MDMNPEFPHLADSVFGGRSARDWARLFLKGCGVQFGEGGRLFINMEYLPHPRDMKALNEAADLIESTCLVDANGEGLAWVDDDAGDCLYRIEARHRPASLKYPWDILDFQRRILETLESRYDAGSVSPLASITGVLQLGKGSVILPGVVIEGHVIIGENCRIGPNCYIRGATSIGDNCLIGQSVEIKSSSIGDRTCISHLAYAGDSVVGSDVNFGAGTVCSNYRHDGATHRVMIGGELIDSKRDKLGAMIGNGARLGCNTTIYPGRIIAAGAVTSPGEVVRKNIR